MEHQERKRKGGKNMPAKGKKWVFAVHNWETGDGYHHVTCGKGKSYRTKRFRNWTKAEQYAKASAKRRHLRSYIVDTPQRPHHKIRI